MNLKNVQQLFPSEDGNKLQQATFLNTIESLMTNIDSLKDPNKSTLDAVQDKTDDFYKDLIENTYTPQSGIGMDQVVHELVNLSKGSPYQTKNYVTNAIPLASIPGVIGQFTAALLNSNSLWDVYGPAAGEAEVKIISMMSKIVGYDYTKSWGYTTWGGQGAVFNGLRLAIVKQFPKSNEEGIPNNLYCFASENAHYSLLKSVEATGIGTKHLITVKAGSDHSMDLDDLRTKLEEVIQNGGIPVYVVATTGVTDSFGIDDVKTIKEITSELEEKYQLKPIHIHADSAMGGFYSFFREYDFANNPLRFEDEVLTSLEKINERMKHIHLADSCCFDFHKLGQNPYNSSLYLIKNGQDFGLLDLEEFDTPYVGNRGYGSYHTGYTLECSRMGSAISIYASLLAFGMEGYQQLLANYVRVNLAFRKKLVAKIPQFAITNNETIGPITTFRLYANKANWEREIGGQATVNEIKQTNELNNQLFEILGKNREGVFFGDTKKQCVVDVIDSSIRQPIYAAKFFSISPYTTIEHLDHIIEAVDNAIKELEEINDEVLIQI